MDMNTAIAELVENIKADYAAWSNAGPTNEIRQRMIVEFNESIRVVPGRKYIKIVKNDSVWGFIVADENDKKFRKGDILKAATWAAPARNKARGNILEGGYTINWTGPHYL